MRKLISFFHRFKVFLVFILLQFLSLGMFFSWISYPRTKFFNTSNIVVGSILNLEYEITKFLTLKGENEKLQKEISVLKEKQSISLIKLNHENIVVNDSNYKQAFTYIPATVIHSSHSNKNNFFTINVGKLNGIREKMGVISGEGVVGIVYDVSNHFAVVKTILTDNFNISAFIDENYAFGIIKYQGYNPRNVSLIGIPNDVVIKKGSKVLTRGSSGYFPKGIIIGTVDEINTVEGEIFWDIQIKTAQDMRRIHNVYVINNLNLEEFSRLQKKNYNIE